MIYDIIEESNSLCRLYGQKNCIINLYGIRRIYVMWTLALGRIGEKQVWKKNQNIFMF